MDPSRPLAEAFLAHLDAEHRTAFAELGGLEGLLGDLVDAGKRAWPTVAVAPDVYVAYVAARVASGDSPRKALEGVRAGEIYLACACAQGSPEALATFEQHYLGDLAQVLGSMKVSSAQVDDVKQNLRRKLLVAEGSEPPKIAQYSGRADLKSWLRVVAVREVLTQLRREKKEVPLEDEALLDSASDAEDPELEHFKRVYKSEFKAAFQAALATLSSRDRNVLRYHFLDGLNIDQIGAIYGVHRATVARWLSRTRQALLDETRRRLMVELRVSRQELESIMRLIHSQLEVSIPLFLKKGEEGPGEP